MKFQDWKIQLKISGELMRWMKRDGHTIETAAKKLRTYPAKVSLLIRQQAYPSLSDLIYVCKEMGVSADYLLCLKEEKDEV